MRDCLLCSQRHAVSHFGVFVRTSRHFGFLIRRVEVCLSWDAPIDDDDSRAPDDRPVSSGVDRIDDRQRYQSQDGKQPMRFCQQKIILSSPCRGILDSAMSAAPGMRRLDFRGRWGWSSLNLVKDTPDIPP